MSKIDELRKLEAELAEKDRAEEAARLEKKRLREEEYKKLRPLRVQMEYDTIIKQIEESIKSREKQCRVCIGYEEVIDLLKKEGFNVIKEVERTERRICLCYERDVWEDTGIWDENIILTITW